MGQVAERLVAKAGSCHRRPRRRVGARQLETDDDAMDRLHRRLFRVLLAEDWPHGVEAAIDITLIGRYYERFADHAVRVARQVVYLVTGETAPTARSWRTARARRRPAGLAPLTRGRRLSGPGS